MSTRASCTSAEICCVVGHLMTGIVASGPGSRAGRAGPSTPGRQRCRSPRRRARPAHPGAGRRWPSPGGHGPRPAQPAGGLPRPAAAGRDRCPADVAGQVEGEHLVGVGEGLEFRAGRHAGVPASSRSARSAAGVSRSSSSAPVICAVYFRAHRRAGRVRPTRPPARATGAGSGPRRPASPRSGPSAGGTGARGSASRTASGSSPRAVTSLAAPRSRWTWPSCGPRTADARCAPSAGPPRARSPSPTAHARPHGAGSAGRCRRCGVDEVAQDSAGTSPSTRCASRGTRTPRRLPGQLAAGGCGLPQRPVGVEPLARAGRRRADRWPGRSSSRLLPEISP